MRTAPPWLVTEPTAEVDLGVLRSGKEAQINIVEWSDDSGRSCLVARKRYLPREVTQKGTLEGLGVARATSFRNDVQYREGRQFRKSRDRRAVERMSTYGRHLLQDRWLGHEHDVMRVLWDAGAPVPFPLAQTDDCFHMQYLGDENGAGTQLARARLGPAAVRDAWTQVIDGLLTITEAGWAHGDLSTYNLLWWAGRVWFIDFPQAVDIAANPRGVDFLHRDVVNVTSWFNRHGVDADLEEVFADVLGALYR